MATFGELLDSGNFVASVACDDCTMGLANGGWPSAEDSAEWTPDRENTVDVTLAEYDVTLGHIHSGEWATGCWHAGTGCADDCDCERTEFSRRDCGVCGSRFDGYRHDVIMVRWDALTDTMGG